MDAFDLVIVGTGNAALSAAISAKENGAKNILVLEKASKKDRGGNSRYTNGAYRFAYEGFSDLKKIIPNLKHTKKIDYGKYTSSNFLRDMNKVTQGKTDKYLSKTLTSKSSSIAFFTDLTGSSARSSGLTSGLSKLFTNELLAPFSSSLLTKYGSRSLYGPMGAYIPAEGMPPKTLSADL